MNVFIFDQDTSEKKRKWEDMLNCPLSRICFDEEVGFRCAGSAVLWGSGVVIVHQVSPKVLKIIEEVVTRHDCLSAIVVSESPQSKESAVPRLYFRKLPVGKPINQSFPGYFKQFLDDLEKSNGLRPNFSLLEPTAVPEALLAYALAVQYQLKIVNIRELCAAADASYKKLQPYAKSLFDKNRAAFPDDADVPTIQKFEPAPGDANGIRFKAMRTVIDLLREDL
jgi:hypothetical protein